MTDSTMTQGQIGSVIALTGSVWAVNGDSQRPLTEGAPVYEGEEIVTESDSNVEIKFADDTILGQGEDSATRLDDYVFDGEDGSLDFQMMKGVMRVVSGEIVKVNPEGFNLSTPLATIGIRGTQVMIQVDQGREFIGVDQLGEGHTVLISNAFSEIVIDKAGLFSGVDFDGSLIAPDEMPDNFITTITRAAPLTILGDEPRTPGTSQEITPPEFYETIDNQTGEYQPGVDMEYAQEDTGPSEGEDEEVFELTEAEIEALLAVETAAGTEETGGQAEELPGVTQVDYDPYDHTPDAAQGNQGTTPPPTSQDDTTDSGDTTTEPPVDEPVVVAPAAEEPAVEEPPAQETADDSEPTAEDVVVEQPSEEENTPVTYNVISEGDASGDDTTLVSAALPEDSDYDGVVNFTSEGDITYVPQEGETGTVVIDYTVADADGDTASAQLTVELAPDSEPTLTVSDATGQEIDGVMVASGTISTDFGADSEGSSISLSAEGASWYGGSQTLIADDASWAIELTDNGYEYSQFSPLSGSTATDPGETLSIDVTVTAIDGDGSIATGDFNVTVNDDGPTATDAVVTQVTEDTAVSYNVISQGDADTGLYEGSLVNAALAEGSEAQGEVGYSADGNITYTPADGETGTVLIDYTVADADGDTASAQLSVTLTEDSAPVITVTGSSGSESDNLVTTSGTLNVDFGADSEGASIELHSDLADWNAETMTLTAEDNSWDIQLTADGYTFTQHENFDHSEGDEFVIEVGVTATDGDGSVTTGDFQVLVADDGPTATDVHFTQDTDEDTAVSYNVITGEDADTGVDGGTLTAAALADDSPFEGIVSHDEDGTITYDPVNGETGTVEINYTVTDGDGDTASAKLYVTLAPDSEPVISTSDVSGDESDDLVTVSGTLDVDFGGDSSGASYSLSAENATWDSESETLTDKDGNWTIAVAEGSYVFTQINPITHTDSTDPNDAFTIDVDVLAIDGDGSESAGAFTVTVNDDGPSAGSYELVQDEVGDTVSYNLFDGGTAIAGMDGATLTSAALTPDSDYGGTVTFDAEGNVSYTPAEGETGTVTIDYTVTDGDGDTASSYLTIDLADPIAEGGQGRDVIVGTDGDDTLDGGQGQDAIFGTEGNDLLIGGQGRDVIFGGSSEDFIIGNKGSDELHGGDDADLILGGHGNDEIYGEAGNDILSGDAGNDSIIGGEGDDLMAGGQGSDTFVFTSPDDGEDLILDFDTAKDHIELYEATFDLSIDSKGNLADNQFTVVDDAEYTGGYDFEGATSGLVYASETGSHIGALYYDPDDTVSGDETLIATVVEADDENITVDNIDIA